MDLLTGIERNNVTSVLKDYEVLTQAVAKLYLAFPNPNSWSYSNIVGVVTLVKRLNTFSFKIVDVEKKEIIWEYDIDSNMTYQRSENYLHVFPYKTIKCMAGFSFTSETEGQDFYNCVINRHTSTKSSPVSSRIGSPKMTATISPLTKNKEIETKNKDKKEKKHKKEKKSKKGLFGFGSSKKSKKSKKGLDKSLIGKPTNFRHEQYIGFDPEKGFVTQNAGPEWQEIFKKAGITPEILADDRNRKIVNKFIKRHESEVKRSNPVIGAPSVQTKKEKRPPPPPPPKKRAPPPPPPQRRPNQARKAPPPPPPQRKKQQRAPPPPPPQRKPNKKTSIPPPPPPPQRPAIQTPSIPAPPPPPQRPAIQTPSISAPPPPPPPPQRPEVQTPTIPPPPPPPPSNQKPSLQSSSAVGIPPPPPPPAPVSGSGAPPPPPPPPVPSTGNAKNDLLASIRNAGGIGSLKHVDESQKRDASGLITPGSSTGPRPAPPAGGSSAPKIGMSGDLLASIRNAGIGSLKHVDKSEIRDASSVKVTNTSSSANTNDLAAALAQALSMRNDAFGSDDDSDSDSDDSDSDSSEWSD